MILTQAIYHEESCWSLHDIVGVYVMYSGATECLIECLIIIDQIVLNAPLDAFLDIGLDQILDFHAVKVPLVGGVRHPTSARGREIQVLHPLHDRGVFHFVQHEWDPAMRHALAHDERERDINVLNLGLPKHDVDFLHAVQEMMMYGSIRTKNAADPTYVCFAHDARYGHIVSGLQHLPKRMEQIRIIFVRRRR